MLGEIDNGMVYEVGEVGWRLCWEDEAMDGVFQARRQ